MFGRLPGEEAQPCVGWKNWTAKAEEARNRGNNLGDGELPALPPPEPTTGPVAPRATTVPTGALNSSVRTEAANGEVHAPKDPTETKDGSRGSSDMDAVDDSVAMSNTASAQSEVTASTIHDKGKDMDKGTGTKDESSRPEQTIFAIAGVGVGMAVSATVILAMLKRLSHRSKRPQRPGPVPAGAVDVINPLPDDDMEALDMEAPEHQNADLQIPHLSPIRRLSHMQVRRLSQTLLVEPGEAVKAHEADTVVSPWTRHKDPDTGAMYFYSDPELGGTGESRWEIDGA